MKFINPSLLLYILASICYLFFFRIKGDVELMMLFKPLILTSITYYYITFSKIKKYFLHFVIIILCFVSDSLNIFRDNFFHEVSIWIYILMFFVLFYLITKDSKLIKIGSSLDKYFGLLVFVGVLLFILTKITSNYIIKSNFHQYFIVLNYIVVFISVFVLSFYNLFKWKTLSSKFLVAMLVCLFLADFLSVINSYYFQLKSILYLSCVFELPIYYFMIKYFINRDIERIK